LLWRARESGAVESNGAITTNAPSGGRAREIVHWDLPVPVQCPDMRIQSGVLHQTLRMQPRQQSLRPLCAVVMILFILVLQTAPNLGQERYQVLDRDAS
jgi:hypothetical protein